MVWWQRSMSSSTETQVAGGVRTLRCGLQTCRVSKMSEVARTLAGTHLTKSQKDCGGHTRTPSPASLATKAADPASQATGRQEKVVKEGVPRPKPLWGKAWSPICFSFFKRAGVGYQAESHHACASEVRTPRAGPTPPCHTQALGG
jgi:hypothetical protein